VEATFRRYRAMSYITGTTLLVLFVTLFLHTVDLKFWDHIHLFVDVVGIGHGIILYPIYMIMCFNLTLKFRLPIYYIAIMLFAGFVPGLAFYLEHRMRVKLYPYGLPAKAPATQ
jgi:integral membrane protein